MNGLELLEAVYHWLPIAILLDLIILQFALRWGHRRWKRRQARESQEDAHRT